MSTNNRFCTRRAVTLVATLVALTAAGTSRAERRVLPGYADYSTCARQLETIARSDFAGLQSLGRTLGGRQVYVLTVGTGQLDKKPAILVVGTVHPPHLVGSELAVRMARQLAEQAEKDEPGRRLLDRVTFYIIPRPTPDACEACLTPPHVERTRNERPTDDDNDGLFNEDGPDDLNGDGLITRMRVEDPSGEYMAHPDDPRVLIKADAKKNEQGRWRLLLEGRDNDGDDRQSEDPPGGVAFNRNFPFRYPQYGSRSGLNAVSEVETRAVADFCFDHPNIAVVLTFTPEDNLFHPWKPGSSDESKRIKTAVLPADAPYLDNLAEAYREIHGGKDAPASDKGEGSFSEWAYFHFGRWSLGCRAWWVPKVPPLGDGDKDKPGEQDAAAEDNDGSKKPKPEDAENDDAEKKPSDEKRGADEVNALRWLEREKIDGFVEWQPVEHPDFPDRKVEVGGFKPFVRLNPPASELDGLAQKHVEFLGEVVDRLPRVRIQRTKAEPLGGGRWRITATAINEGYLPTMPKMGEVSKVVHPLQIELETPKGVSLVTGHPRSRLPVLAGNGGKAEQTWLVTAPADKALKLGVRVWSPSTGEATTRIQLAPKESGK